MIRFLRLVPAWGWVIGTLSAALVAGWMYHQSVVASRDALADKLSRSQSQVHVLESALAWRRQHAATLAQALETREREILAAQNDIQRHRAALDKLERDNDKTRAYLDSALPGDIAGWVRGLAEQDGDSAGDDDAGRTAPPADSAASPHARR